MILINSSPKDALKIFQPFLPIYVPVGIGCILAMAERENITVDFVDEQVEPDLFGAVGRLVAGKSRPYIFGFSVLTASFKQAITVSEQLKRRYPDSVICFGGIHPTSVPDEVLLYPHIDMVLRGEADYALLDLYRRIKNGEDYSHLKSLSYRRDGKIIHNESAPAITNLDLLPRFPYHLFDPSRYDLGFIISSRGCPHRCIFCSNRITTGKKYRVRSADVIVDEIELLHRDYGKRQILFLDDNLLVDRPRIYELMEKLRGRGLHKGISFSFQARGDNADRQLLHDLYETGFKSVFFGLETASEKIMRSIQKGETVAQCVDAVKMAKAAGFHVSATFIYALPGETHEDRMACVSLSRKLDIDMVRFNNATPYPGTELYSIARQEGRLNIQGLYENFVSVSTFIENPLQPIPFSYVPEGNTERQIRRDILLSYFLHYCDLAKIKRIFSKPELGVGWFNAGSRLKDIMKKMPALVFLSAMMLLKFAYLAYMVLFKKETALPVREVYSLLVRKRN